MKILEQIGEFLGTKMRIVYNVIHNHVLDYNNPHRVTKDQVGLGNVDNTSDMDKPLSEAQRNAIGNLSNNVSSLEGVFDSHTNNQDIHHSTEGMNSLVDEKINSHNSSVNSHQDIRNSINDILEGNLPGTKSEYADKLGDENDFYTKTSLDQKLRKHVKSVDYNPATAVFTFTFEDETTTIIDTPVEGTVKDGRLDSVSNELVLVLVSGQEIRIPVSNLIKIYTGEDTETISTIITTDGKISSYINDGSIDKVHLSQTLLQEIQSCLNNADDLKTNVATFEESTIVENIVPGEKISVILGKIMKWFSSWSSKLVNLADDPNATYARKDELGEIKEFNTIYLNTANIDTIQDGVLDADLLEQISKFDDLGKPFHLVFNDVSMYVCDNVQSMKTDNYIRIIATIPGELQEKMGGNTIDASYLSNNGGIVINIYSATGDNIFLTENVDGMITTVDRGWTDFASKLTRGEKPAIYLKSKNSDGYCPAIYEFTKDSGTGALKGFIEISYPKIAESVKELWVEKWVFTNGIVSAVYQYSIEKFPLESQETPVFTLETTKNGSEFTVTNPEVIEDIVAAGNQGKNPRVFLLQESMLVEAESVTVSSATGCLLSFSLTLASSNTSVRSTTIVAAKTNDAWSTIVNSATLTQNDFMQVKNIYVVTEYPSSLLAYPEGSIIIKQQAS